MCVCASPSVFQYKTKLTPSEACISVTHQSFLSAVCVRAYTTPLYPRLLRVFGVVMMLLAKYAHETQQQQQQQVETKVKNRVAAAVV